MGPKTAQSSTMEMAGGVRDEIEEILKLVEKENSVVLEGEAGVGKTWLAREVCKFALASNKSCGTIWIFPDDRYEESALIKNIACQLCIFPPSKESDDDDEDGMEEEANEKKGEWSPDGLTNKISEKLQIMVEEVKHRQGKASNSDAKAPGDQQNLYLLAVLDDIPAKDEAEIVGHLKNILPQHVRLKFLITRSKSDENAGPGENRDTIEPASKSITHPVSPLSLKESRELLCANIGKGVSWIPGPEKSYEYIAKNSHGLPAAIVMIAQAIKHVGLDTINNETYQNAMEEAIIGVEPDNVQRLLMCAQEMLPSNVMKDCFWQSRQLFTKCCRLNYVELITYWILEGFFNYDQIDQSYEEAHNVLMELRDRCFLRERGNSYISLEKILNEKLSDLTRGGSSQAASLGLANVLDDVTFLGKITRMDGMIKTHCRKFGDISTLIIDGDRLCRENQKTFFDSLKGLKVLAILNSNFKSLPPSLFKLKDLQVLVLRGFRLLKNIDGIHELTSLLVLEVSGAYSLENIDDDVFKEMANLRSVNLSATGVTTLPQTLLNRPELRWLILRECKNLQYLPPVKSSKLEVLDLSGSVSLTNLRNKTLDQLPELHTINLSRTRISKLPFFRKLRKFSRLLLRDCRSLQRLPALKQLSALEILDLSGSINLYETPDDSLENNSKLRVLDLSKSGITILPSHLGHLSNLNLNGCSNLPTFPFSILKLQTLEFLDLSGVPTLEQIDVTSFEHLKLLRGLVLSHTDIKELPSLSPLVELRRLVLKDCKFLKKLEGLDALDRLEVIDLSGCLEVEISENTSFQHMSFLRTLDLSETRVKQLPSNCFPNSLHVLKLTNCSELQQLPSLESLSQLEVLDLYGAKSLNGLNANFLLQMRNLQILNLSKVPLENLPSLSNLTKLKELSLHGRSFEVGGLKDLTELELLDLSNTKINSLSIIGTNKLKQLFLRDCKDLDDLKDLESFSQLEVLDLSGTRMRNFPHKILDFPHLRKLVLENMKEIGEIDWTKVSFLPEELNMGTVKSRKMSMSDKIPSLFIRGAQFFQFLKENKDLWQNCFQRFHFFVSLHKEDTKDGTGLCYMDMGFFRHFNSRGRSFFPIDYDCSLEILGSNSHDVQKNNLGEATSLDAADVQKNASEQATLSDNPIVQKDALGPPETTDQQKNNLGEATSSNNSGMRKNASGQAMSSNSPVVQNDTLEQVESTEVEKSNLAEATSSDTPEVQKDASGQATSSDNPVVQKDPPGEAESAHFPNVLKFALGYAKHLSLIDSPIVRISHLVKENANELKSLWLELCTKIEFILCEEEDTIVGEKLEHLYLSYLPSFSSLCNDKLHSKVFTNLLSLSLDGCPKLESILPTSKLPPNLETLQIRFCYNVETLFKPDVSEECKLLKLKYLELLDLPNMKSIGVSMPALETMKVRHCLKLEKLNETLEQAESLEDLSISDVVGLKSLCTENPSPRSFKILKILKLESCPDLTKVFISPQLPLHLMKLEIKCCDKLTTVCEADQSSGCPFPSLSKLHLWKLPELKDNWGRVAAREDYCIRECPKFCKITEGQG